MPIAPVSPNVGGDLSRVVRPFGYTERRPTRARSERGLVFGRTSYVEPATEEDLAGVLRWNATQTAGVSTLGALGIEVHWPDDNDAADSDLLELHRDTQVKRVFNPSDSEQYVDVETIQKVTVQSARKKLKSSITFNND